MSDSVKVSVVIPCYNVKKYVEEAVKSSIVQTYPVTQIICVDDGSTDDTLRVLRDLKHEYPEKLVIRSGPNRGGNHARNIGLGIVESNYVQFLDADDVLSSDKIEHQVQLIQNTSTTVDLVVAAYRKGETPERSTVREPGHRSDLANLAGSALGRTSSNLWRASAVRDVGGWNESMRSSQEYELMFKMIQKNAHIVYDYEPKTWIRKRDESITGKSSIEVPRGIVELRIEIVKYARNNCQSLKELEKIEESTFYWIKHLRMKSLKEAVKYHKKVDFEMYFPSPRKYGYIYVFLLSIFGFEITEKIRESYKYARKFIR